LASSTGATWIIVGVVLGVLLLATLSVLLFLHIRRQRRESREDVEDRFEAADYGLDELPGAGKKSRPTSDDEMKSQDGSSSGRRSRDPLQVGVEPKYPAQGHLNGHLNPFDDGSSSRSGKR